jgi:hypothetical protein
VGLGLVFGLAHFGHERAGQVERPEAVVSVAETRTALPSARLTRSSMGSTMVTSALSAVLTLVFDDDHAADTYDVKSSN